jgi:hypothetical protein
MPHGSIQSFRAGVALVLLLWMCSGLIANHLADLTTPTKIAIFYLPGILWIINAILILHEAYKQVTTLLAGYEQSDVFNIHTPAMQDIHHPTTQVRARSRNNAYLIHTYIFSRQPRNLSKKFQISTMRRSTRRLVCLIVFTRGDDAPTSEPDEAELEDIHPEPKIVEKRYPKARPGPRGSRYA